MNVTVSRLSLALLLMLSGIGIASWANDLAGDTSVPGPLPLLLWKLAVLLTGLILAGLCFVSAGFHALKWWRAG